MDNWGNTYVEPDWAAIVHETRTGEKPETGQLWTCRSTLIAVRMVDPEGEWAMIHCKTSMSGFGLPSEWIEWDKQQPLVDRRFPNNWKLQQMEVK